LRRTALAAVVALLVLASRASAQAASGPDWDRWPWMDAQIPTLVQLSASVVPIDSGRDFQGILIFHNSGRDSVRVTFGSCSFGLRLYHDSLQHTPPLWDNRPAPNSGCTLEGHVLMLGPDERREHVVRFIRDVFARPPLPGRYVATITWRPSNAASIRDVAAGNLIIR
jgi:hypothetical protein